MGGLFAGLMLSRAGWNVDVFERVGQELAGRGAGIVTHPELESVLTLLGCHPGDELGVPVDRRRTFDCAGKVVAEMDCPQITTSWTALFAVLRSRFPLARYHFGKEVIDVATTRHGAVAGFRDGSRIEADLLVAADGSRSLVRRRFLPEVDQQYAGYVAWRGLVEEHRLSPELREELFPYFAFCLPAGEQILGYPVAGADNDLRSGHRQYNFVWYRSADSDEALPRFLTDDCGRRHAAIPPDLISCSTLAEVRSAAADRLSPQFRDLVLATQQLLLQPIYDLETPQMSFGRCILIGDAAFVARPHVGAGVTKAAEDAVALVRALEDSSTLDAALERYSDERRAVGTRIISEGRRLGAAITQEFAHTQCGSSTGRHQDPVAVMAATARLHFLHA